MRWYDYFERAYGYVAESNWLKFLLLVGIFALAGHLDAIDQMQGY
jgi:hypothetical protein